jgi:hypothetical protein
MNEEQWLAASDFERLYDSAKATPRCSERTRLLLQAAVCRLIGPLYPDAVCLEAVEAVESVADGRGGAGVLEPLHRRLEGLTESGEGGC